MSFVTVRRQRKVPNFVPRPSADENASTTKDGWQRRYPKLFPRLCFFSPTLCSLDHYCICSESEHRAALSDAQFSVLWVLPATAVATKCATISGTFAALTLHHRSENICRQDSEQIWAPSSLWTDNFGYLTATPFPSHGLFTRLSGVFEQFWALSADGHQRHYIYRHHSCSISGTIEHFWGP